LEIENINRIHFIGIGGIGMSNLARYFLSKGVSVSGYDRVKTDLTDRLANEGAAIHFVDELDSIKQIDKIDLVVYTPAIPMNHNQLSYFIKSDLPVIKRAELLGLITKNSYSIAIAGTHGKTTTSCIVAHMLEHSGMGCNAFLGGISTNYNSNFIINKNIDRTVVEADEYDRSFLNLSPDISIITSMDADHLDIYGDRNEMDQCFQDFVELLPDDGKLIVNYGLPVNFKNRITYGENKSSDLVISNINIKEGNYHFDVQYRELVLKDIYLGLPGRHNVYNAASAILLSLELGMEVEMIRSSLASFKGVKRRFEYKLKSKDLIYIDDYAHHPKELDVCIESARELYPNKMLTGIFQPHLYSRTRDFLSEFAVSLSALDEVILLDIYPARELPISGISSSVLLDKINCGNKKLMKMQEVIPEIENRYIEVLLSMGAGNIDELVQPIKMALENKNELI
jgi:UDP-N-acetylmuramate--alanine ligase